MAPSVLLFLCELFLLEGLADVSAEDSALVDFSALVAFSPVVDFFELLLLELEEPPVVSVADSSLAPFGVAPALELGLRVALGDAAAPAVAVAEAVAAAVALGDAVAEAVALGDALAVGDALTPVAGLGEA